MNTKKKEHTTQKTHSRESVPQAGLIAWSSGIASLLLPVSAVAYVGPGAGLSAIGTVIALIGAVLLGIVGFVWYPIKRLLRRGKTQPTPPKHDSAKRESVEPEQQQDGHPHEEPETAPKA